MSFDYSSPRNLKGSRFLRRFGGMKLMGGAARGVDPKVR